MQTFCLFRFVTLHSFCEQGASFHDVCEYFEGSAGLLP